MFPNPFARNSFVTFGSSLRSRDQDSILKFNLLSSDIRMLVTGLAGLEVWCQRMTEAYPGVRISNMTEAWRDGLGFAAIIHRHRPDLIDFGSLKPGDIQR